jgi:hypothetical protein
MDMKIKLSSAYLDAIGIILIVTGIAMTISLYIAIRGPSVEVQSMTIHEIAPDAPSRPGI